MVKVKNDSSIYQGQMEDFYKVSENINGVTTWVSYSKAIWYNDNYWVIGDLNNIGKNLGGIFSNGKNERFST